MQKIPKRFHLNIPKDKRFTGLAGYYARADNEKDSNPGMLALFATNCHNEIHIIIRFL